MFFERCKSTFLSWVQSVIFQRMQDFWRTCAPRRGSSRRTSRRFFQWRSLHYFIDLYLQNWMILDALLCHARLEIGDLSAHWWTWGRQSTLCLMRPTRHWRLGIWRIRACRYNRRTNLSSIRLEWWRMYVKTRVLFQLPEQPRTVWATLQQHNVTKTRWYTITGVYVYMNVYNYVYCWYEVLCR